jgi:hypothetical protein
MTVTQTHREGGESGSSVIDSETGGRQRTRTGLGRSDNRRFLGRRREVQLPDSSNYVLLGHAVGEVSRLESKGFIPVRGDDDQGGTGDLTLILDVGDSKRRDRLRPVSIGEDGKRQGQFFDLGGVSFGAVD